MIIGAVVTPRDSLRAGNGLKPMLHHLFSRERMPSQTLGLCLMVLGTLIWAFGDPFRRLAA